MDPKEKWSVLSTTGLTIETAEFSFSSMWDCWNFSSVESVISVGTVDLEPSAFNSESTKLALRSSSVSSTLLDESPARVPKLWKSLFPTESLLLSQQTNNYKPKRY